MQVPPIRDRIRPATRRALIGASGLSLAAATLLASAWLPDAPAPVLALLVVAGGTILLGLGVRTARVRGEAAAARPPEEPAPGAWPEATARAALDLAAEAILVADTSRAGRPISYVNPAFVRLTGFSAEEACGRPAAFLHGVDLGQPEIAEIEGAIAAGRALRRTLRSYRHDGALFWNDLSLEPRRDASGEVTHYVATMRDATAIHGLRRLAFTDPLTGLPNRACFRDRLHPLLADPASEFVLIAKLGLCRLHELNSAAGQAAGDTLLREVARRLTEALPRATVGRVGGSALALAIGMQDEFAAEEIIGQLRGPLAERVAVGGMRIDPAIAIGFTVASRGADRDAALQQTAVALAEARAAGGGETRRFDAGTEAAMRTRMRLTSELQQAIEEGDLRLRFQPKVDLATGAVIGAEALARWEHRLFGIQPPSRFIPVAEQSGLIGELGEWVLRRSARFAAALNQGRAVPLPISVNVSPLQFRRGDLVRTMERIALESGIRPQWLTLEVTETVLAETSPERLATLQRLRDAGFGISIDDFGTGYSSLAYLRSFPVSEIKIDRSFISHLGATRYNHAIIEAVLKIGASLDAAVCAEGIETEAERERLLEMGCRLGQGFLFSRPVEERALLELLARRETAGRHAA